MVFNSIFKHLRNQLINQENNLTKKHYIITKKKIITKKPVIRLHSCQNNLIRGQSLFEMEPLSFIIYDTSQGEPLSLSAFLLFAADRMDK